MGVWGISTSPTPLLGRGTTRHPLTPTHCVCNLRVDAATPVVSTYSGVMTTATLYLRQSLDRSGEGMAVARQEKECRALCKRLGFTVGEVFTDNDTSATSGVARPGFERLLASQPEVVVAWHQDRLLRLTRDLERVIDLDVPVHTVTAGTLDLTNPAGRAVARTVAAWSQYEGEQKALRQRAAHRQRAAAGIPWGDRRPFGYSDDHITPHAKEAPVVAQMYADLLAGVPQSQIARTLNEAGHLTTLGNQWHQSTVRGLLMNPRNAGLRAHNGEVVGAGQWQPLVTEEVWRAAVAVMTQNRGRGRGGGKRKYLMTGLAVCGECAHTLGTGVSRVGVTHYVCRNCRRVSRNVERLDQYVVDHVITRLTQPDAIELVTRSDTDTGQARQDAVAAREALDNLSQMYGSGEITLSAFRAGTQRAQERLDAAEAQLLDTGRADRLGGLIGAADVAAAWADLDLARRRGVVDALMTVRVCQTRKGARFRPEDVHIEWKGTAA